MEKNTVSELLSRRVRSLWKAKNLAKEELAVKCELQVDLIEAIEKAEGDPTLADLARISEVLGVEMFDLFRNEQEERFPSMVRRDIIEIMDEMGRKNRKNYQLILVILHALMRSSLV
jgi:transcriptional regulator with XRE-family HTH domain